MLQEFFPVLEGVPMGDLWVLLAWGLLFMVVWMFALYLLHFKLKNAGIVDFGWAAGLAFLGVFYALKGDGYTPRRYLIGAMVLIWGGRLAWHILSDRILGGKEEDPRYTAIRESWKNYIGIKLFFYFEFQAILCVLLSVPFALLVIDPLQRITGYEWLSFCIWVVAMGGEAIADAQLKAFKSHPDNHGRVCEDGFWYHSRHPNYFFEWLVWMAYFVAAMATDYGAWTMYCPILMLYFLFKVTGIPLTEKHALESRGAEYAEYQKTTSAFVPWFKKSPPPEE